MSFIEDGDGVHGAPIATIANTNYIVNSADIPPDDAESEWSVDHDENDVPVRQRGASRVGEGNITLQFIGNDSTPPNNLTAFTFDDVGLIVSSVSKVYEQGGYRRVNIGVRKEINGG